MTTMYSSFVFTTLTTLFFTGCAGMPSAPFPDIPREWEVVANTERGVGDCRNLTGIYSLAAESNYYSDNGWELRQISETAIYSGLIGPAEAAGIPKSRLENVDPKIGRNPNSKFFRIRFDAPVDLFVDYYVSKDGAIYSFHFSRDLDQFSCETGIIKFPIKVDLSGGEGVQANSQRIRMLGSNKNGDLILYDQTSQAKWAINTPKPTFRIFKFVRN